jgi:site-specific recombinase XerD
MMNSFFKSIRNFLADYLPNRREYSVNTVQSYRDALKLLIMFLREVKGYKLAQIDFNIFSTELIFEFLTWLKYSRNCSTASVNQRITALRSFFSYAADQDCTLIALSLEINKKVKAKKQYGKVVGFLSESALKAILAQPDEKNRIGLRNLTLMILMYDTGARCGEILQMKVRDLRLNTPHPQAYLMGKGRKPRCTPLLPKTVSHCERYLKTFHADATAQGDEFLFYTVIHGTRNSISADTVAAFMKKYGKMARHSCPEVPELIHPHMMRHTRAMHYYHDGMPLVMLAEILGHVDIQTTKIYAAADTEMKRKAMEKVDSNQKNVPEPSAIWEDNEDMILQLSGLSN